jgi:hypothetical protein
LFRKFSSDFAATARRCKGWVRTYCHFHNKSLRCDPGYFHRVLALYPDCLYAPCLRPLPCFLAPRQYIMAIYSDPHRHTCYDALFFAMERLPSCRSCAGCHSELARDLGGTPRNKAFTRSKIPRKLGMTVRGKPFTGCCRLSRSTRHPARQRALIPHGPSSI